MSRARAPAGGDGAAAVEPAGRTHTDRGRPAWPLHGAAPSFGLPSRPVVGESENPRLQLQILRDTLTDRACTHIAIKDDDAAAAAPRTAQ